jgi:hypothetical protein
MKQLIAAKLTECSDCGLARTAESRSFYKNRSRCKSCYSKVRNHWRCNTPGALEKNRAYSRKSRLLQRPYHMKCKACGESFSSGRKGAMFCSIGCSTRFQRDNEHRAFIEQWLKGADSMSSEVRLCGIKSSSKLGGKAGGRASGHVRRFLAETYGEKCSICSWAEIHAVTGHIPVQLDHIDGNSENNKPDNVRLLCPNCHSLTSTFGILNRGRGRADRQSRRLKQKGKL